MTNTQCNCKECIAQIELDDCGVETHSSWCVRRGHARAKFMQRYTDLENLAKASEDLGAWMSAALDDMNACVEFKRDAKNFLEALESLRVARADK